MEQHCLTHPFLDALPKAPLLQEPFITVGFPQLLFTPVLWGKRWGSWLLLHQTACVHKDILVTVARVCVHLVLHSWKLCVHGSTHALVHELVGGSRVWPHLEDVYGHLLTIESVWAHGVCEYLLSVFVSIRGVICLSLVCKRDWLFTC